MLPRACEAAYHRGVVGGRRMIATVEWESEGVGYGVSCPKVTKDDVVRVARSLVP